MEHAREVEPRHREVGRDVPHLAFQFDSPCGPYHLAGHHLGEPGLGRSGGEVALAAQCVLKRRGEEVDKIEAEDVVGHHVAHYDALGDAEEIARGDGRIGACVCGMQAEEALRLDDRLGTEVFADGELARAKVCDGLRLALEDIDERAALLALRDDGRAAAHGRDYGRDRLVEVREGHTVYSEE